MGRCRSEVDPRGRVDPKGERLIRLTVPSTRQVVRRLILFGYPSDAKSLQPVAAVNGCVPAMGELLRQFIAIKQQVVAAQGQGQGQAVKARYQTAGIGCIVDLDLHALKSRSRSLPSPLLLPHCAATQVGPPPGHAGPGYAQTRQDPDPHPRITPLVSRPR